MTSPQAGSQIVLVDADAVVFADDGVEAEITEEAVDLADSSVMSIVPPVGQTTLIPLWQTNSTGLAVARWCYWSLLCPSVALISGVAPATTTQAATRKARARPDKWMNILGKRLEA
ncbi:hypothetical protein [Phenylobacterium sp.]|uniref:hypothetical protein n=1 Tax=Phenylobacterium sp. TaxID=1871053 RepID=UPI002F3E7213